jgi:hypothetical protein
VSSWRGFFGAGWTFALTEGIGVSIVFGVIIGLTAGPAPGTAITDLTLAVTGRGRVRLVRLLAGAHQRQVLRQVGPIYQFRHAGLQDYLAGLASDRESVRRLARDYGQLELGRDPLAAGEQPSVAPAPS